jgi:predicted Zn finger-like uncharacterized protein
MPLQIICPQCRQSYRVADEGAGSTVRCRQCGQTFVALAAEADRSTNRIGATATKTAPGSSATSGKRVPPRKDNATNGQPPGLPDKIGRFEIRARLGAGAFGVVYRAFDPVLKRDVALKTPHAALVGDEPARQRFLREAAAAAQLRHPHIVPVYDAGLAGDQGYIASAFIEGQTLEAAIAGARLEMRSAAECIRKLAGALDYAGRRGIIHRDVKPANVLLDSQREPHLTDFGLARWELSGDAQTQDGSLMGTPAYMSPEQAGAPVGPVTVASDQYALGVVLYELLCGQRPFNGPPLVVLYEVREKSPAPPRSINPKIPADLETICRKAMARQPGDRYADCGQLAEDLRRWLADEPIQARPLGPSERMSRWCRRQPLTAAAVGVAFISLLAASLVFGVATTSERLARRQAEQALSDAEAARREAETARSAESLARGEESRQRAAAEKAAAEANASALAEATSRQSAERTAYVNRVGLAYQEVRGNHLPHARELLDACQPSAGQDDLRGWDWRFVRRLCDPAVRRIEFERQAEHVAWRADGSLLAIAVGPIVSAWDPRTGERKWEYKRDHHGLEGLSFSPFGGLLAASLNSPPVTLINADSGLPEGEIPTGQTPIAFAPTEQTLAVHVRQRPPEGGNDLQLIVLFDVSDPKSPQPIRRMQLEDRPRHLAFSPDGARLAVSTGGEITMIQSMDGATLWSDKRAELSAFTPDGARLAVGHGRLLRILDAATGQSLQQFSDMPDDITSLSFPRDARHLFIASGGELLFNAPGKVTVWDLEAGREAYSYLGHAAGIRDMVVSRDGAWMATAGTDDAVLIWDATGDPAVRALHGTEYTSHEACVAFTSDGARLATMGDQVVQIIDPVNGQTVATIPGQGTSLSAMALTSDGSHVATGRPGWNAASATHVGGHVRVWRVTDGAEVARFDFESSEPEKLAFSPDGRLLATLVGGEVIAWDWATGREVLRGPGSGGIAFSPDGKELRTSLAVWKSPAWAREDSPIGCAHDLAYSPDARTIATAYGSTGELGEARLWDASTGEPIRSFRGQLSLIKSLSFSPDGLRLATASWDATVKVWDVASGHEVLTFEHERGASSVAFSPDGRFLASTSRFPEWALRIWDAGLANPSAK